MNRRALLVIAASIVLPALIYVGLDWLIESDEEKVEAIVETMVEAVEEEDIDALLAAVPADYRHDNLTREDLRALSERYFEAYGKTTLYTRGIAPNVTGNTAVANISLFWTSERNNLYTGGAGTRWQMTFIKRGEEWMVTEITPLSFGRYDLEGWRRITGNLGYRP